MSNIPPPITAREWKIVKASLGGESWWQEKLRQLCAEGDHDWYMDCSAMDHSTGTGAQLTCSTCQIHKPLPFWWEQMAQAYRSAYGYSLPMPIAPPPQPARYDASSADKK